MNTTTYRGRRLDATLRELHAAVDQLQADTVPESYYLQVLASRGQPTVEPPDAAVEVVEAEVGPATQGEMFQELPPAGEPPPGKGRGPSGPRPSLLEPAS